MRLTLNPPVQLGSQTLEWVDFRRATAGDMLFARGDIAKDPRMANVMVNDPMTIAAYVARRTVLASNYAGNLPDGWVFMIGMGNLTDLADVVNAMDAGFDSLEAFRADAEAKAAEAEKRRVAEERGETFLAEPAADRADGAPAVSGATGASGGAGESDEGRAGAGTPADSGRI